MQTEEKINAKLWPLHIKWPTATRKMSRILYYGQHEMLFFLESIHFIKNIQITVHISAQAVHFVTLHQVHSIIFVLLLNNRA